MARVGLQRHRKQKRKRNLVNTENRKTPCRLLSCPPPPMQILSLAPGLEDPQFMQQALQQRSQNNDYDKDWPILGSNPSRVKVCFSSRTRHNRLQDQQIIKTRPFTK
jgi:hypothetical protein